MVSISVFIDSSVVIAFHNRRDMNHRKAENLMSDIINGKYGQPFISDYVFDECITVALIRLKDLKEAVNLGTYLINSEIYILKVTESIINKAWEIFQKRNTGKLSFTDCVNIALLEMLDLDCMATFDKGFEKIPGLRIVGL